MRQCQLGFKANRDADSITEAVVLKVKGAGEIRELYRAIFGIPGKPRETELKSKKEIGNEWEAMGGKFKK